MVVVTAIIRVANLNVVGLSHFSVFLVGGIMVLVLVEGL